MDNFSVGFDQIITSITKLFYSIYITGQLLWDWLSSPLSEIGMDLDILGDLVNYTPFELMFGAGLILVLIMCLVKFVMPL